MEAVFILLQNINKKCYRDLRFIFIKFNIKGVPGLTTGYNRNHNGT